MKNNVSDKKVLQFYRQCPVIAEASDFPRTFPNMSKRSFSLTLIMLMSTTCFAAGTGTSAVTQPLENLKTLIIAVIGAVGVIILAKNVMEFAQGFLISERM